MDLVAFNRTLGDSKRNVAIFVTLDAQSSPLTKQAFILVFGTLVTHQEYKLAGKYLDADAHYATARDNYQFLQKFAADKPQANADRMLNHARESFSNKIATAVAVLVKNNREAEAKKMADAATKELSTPEFKAQLEKALQGEPPKQIIF
jgi:transposase